MKKRKQSTNKQFRYGIFNGKKPRLFKKNKAR